MDINLEYYKIFYFVARHQSITLAAEALSISQPAVSQAVKHLENALRCVLFLRMSRGVRLTREGEMLFSYVIRKVSINTCYPLRADSLIKLNPVIYKIKKRTREDLVLILIKSIFNNVFNTR